MEEKTICLPLDEYAALTLLQGRVKAFEGYLNSGKYSIERETAAAILGLELAEGNKDA